jgi:hypothetical protein
MNNYFYNIFNKELEKKINFDNDKNFEVSLKADLITKDKLINQLLERLVKKEEDIKKLQQKLEVK